MPLSTTTRRAQANEWIAHMRRDNPALRAHVLAWAADGKPLTIGLYEPPSLRPVVKITVEDAP